jgi:DNA-binding MarR family transcriptional regulator
LLILSVLLRTGLPISFTDLRKTLDLTDGTLSVHLSKLEEGHLIKVRKTFVGKKPQTLVRITGRGKKLFDEYVQDLKDIVPGLD